MKSFYEYLTYVSILLYLLVLFGVFQYAPTYLIYVTSFIKIYISLLLIYKYHPFNKTNTLSVTDKKIIFSSGVYLLLTTVIGEYLLYYKEKIQNTVEGNIKTQFNNFYN